MDLIDKENTWHDLSTAFLSPFSNFLVNLFANFLLDFTDITSKESKEALSSAVDNINFVKGHSVNNFFSLLKLAFRALNKPCLGSYIVIIAAASE